MFSLKVDENALMEYLQEPRKIEELKSFIGTTSATTAKTHAIRIANLNKLEFKKIDDLIDARSHYFIFKKI